MGLWGSDRKERCDTEQVPVSTEPLEDPKRRARWSPQSQLGSSVLVSSAKEDRNLPFPACLEEWLSFFRSSWLAEFKYDLPPGHRLILGTRIGLVSKRIQLCNTGLLGPSVLPNRHTQSNFGTNLAGIMWLHVGDKYGEYYEEEDKLI